MLNIQVLTEIMYLKKRNSNKHIPSTAPPRRPLGSPARTRFEILVQHHKQQAVMPSGTGSEMMKHASLRCYSKQGKHESTNSEMCSVIRV